LTSIKINLPGPQSGDMRHAVPDMILALWR